MKPLEHDAITEPDPRQGRKVFGQTIYVTALERGTHDRTHARPTRVETLLPERIELKLRPQDKYRGRFRYPRSRSIPELCRITLTPTGDEDLDQEFDDELLKLHEFGGEEPGAEPREVYISQYTHCFEGKIEKPYIAAWKQDFEPCHVAHGDSKFCVLNTPVGSKSRDRATRPKSAPPGSFLFDFEKMDTPKPLFRRSISQGMLIGDWMGTDEMDYGVDDDKPTIVRPQAEEMVTAQSVLPYESLSSSLWDDAFNGIEKESRDDVTQDPMQQARSLISELRSSVRTPDHFRKTYPQPVHGPQAMNPTPEKEFQEHSPRSKAPPGKAFQEHSPWSKAPPGKAFQEHSPRSKAPPGKAFRGSLPRIKPKPKRVSQESLHWIKKEVPEVEKRSESTNARTRPEKTAPTTPKETKDITKVKKEKGLNEMLRDLIGDLEPNDRVSAFKIPQATQEIRTNHDAASTPTKSRKVVEVMTSPVSSRSEARIDQSDGRVVGEKAAKFMTSPVPHTSQPRINQSNGKMVDEKTAKFTTSPVSYTSQPRIDQSNGRVVGGKPKRDHDVSKVQKPEIEMSNRKSEDEARNRKKSKDEENSQPSDVYSKVTSLSNCSRTRNSSQSSDASYKKRLTSAWIEQQRLNIHRDGADHKEPRMRRTKSADLQSEAFKMDEEKRETKPLKHSKSELSFEQLEAMYDPFGERNLTARSSNGLKGRAVHTTEPTVITKARSVEHKLHKITYAKSPVEPETLTKSGEEVLRNEAPLLKSEELPKIMKFQSVYVEKTPEQAKFKVDNKTTTEPQIVPPKATSQSGTRASPSTRIKAKHVEGKEVVSSVVSVTANEIEGAKYPVVQDSDTRGSTPENKPRESGEAEINATRQKPALNGGPHYVKVRSKETKNPVEKFTARFLKGKETTKVRRIASPTDRLDRDGNNNRPKSPGDTALGLATPVEKNVGGKSAAGKKGAAFLSALKNVKIRKAKSEPNLEKEAEDLKDGVKDGDEREEVAARDKGNRYPLGSTPNLSPINTEENEREAQDTSVEHFDDTSRGKRERKSPKSGLPALKISSMYPKFKKFKMKLRKSNNQQSSEEADVSESGNSGSYSIQEILRSDQSTASFVTTGSEHKGTVSEDQIDITEIEEDVFAVQESADPKMNPSNDDGAIELSPRIRNTVPLNGEKKQSKAKVTKVKIISRETGRNVADGKNDKTDRFTPTTSSSSNSERNYNNVGKQKTPTSSAGNISNVRHVSGETWPRENTKKKGKESIVSPVATSTREVPGFNNVQHKTKEATNNVVVLRDTQFHKEARNKNINRLSMPEISSWNGELKQTETDKRRATVIGSAVDVSKISSTETRLVEDESNKGKTSGLIRAKVSTVNARTTLITEDVTGSTAPENHSTTPENSKNEDDETSKKISRKRENVEKKEFGRKIKGFMIKVLPFNHRGKINPQKEFAGIDNETREKVDETDNGLERHFESAVSENTREVLVDVSVPGSKVELTTNHSATAKAVGYPRQASPQRKAGELLKAKTYVLQPEVKVTSRAASEDAEDYEKLQKESVTTGNESPPAAKYSSRVQHLPQLAAVKTIVEREQASKFERTRKNGERKSFSASAGNGEDDDVTKSDDVTRPRQLVAMLTVDPVRTATVVDNVKEERISKAMVGEGLESIDSAFDLLSSAFGDGENTRGKTMATTEAASTATKKRCMKQERITKAQVSDDPESLEAAFDFLSSGKGRESAGKDRENAGNKRENAGNKRENAGNKRERVNGEIQGYERTSWTIDDQDRKDLFTKKNEETVVRENARISNNEKENNTKESADEKESHNHIKPFTTDKRPQKNIESDPGKRNLPTTNGASQPNLYHGRIKGATIDEKRHQAIRVQTAPSPRSEHVKNSRSINLERETTTVKNRHFVESREEQRNVDSRGSRRGVTGVLMNHDESAKKRHLQYVEKVTMTRSTMASDVTRGARGKKETGTSLPEDRSQVRSGDKFSEAKLKQRDFLGDGNDTKRRDNAAGESANWSQTRSGYKFPAVKLERSNLLESQANTKEQVDVGGSVGWSQIRSGDKSPEMKLDWGNDGNEEGPGLENDSVSSDSIKASSEDELLQLIEDQIASEESDEGDRSDNDDGDTTPVPENNPEIYSTARKTPEAMKNSLDTKTTDVSHRSQNTPVGVVSTQKTEVDDGRITPKIRTEHAMKSRVDPTIKPRVASAMKSRVDPTIKPRVAPAMKSRVDPTMKPRVDPMNDHADLLTNGHRKMDGDKYQGRTVSSSMIQKATFSFVDMNVVEEIGRHSGEITPPDNKDYLFNYSSHSGRNSEVEQQSTGKRSKHFTKKKRQTNSKSSEDLSTRLKRLLTDDSSGPDDSSLYITSPIYSLSEDSEFDTPEFFKSKARFSNTPTDQRQYRSLERPKRTTKNIRMSRSSQISPNEVSSDDENYRNGSGFDSRSHSKTL